MSKMRQGTFLSEEVRTVQNLFQGISLKGRNSWYNQSKLVGRQMSHTYPVADYLTRVRNAQKAGKRWVDIPSSNFKKSLSIILRKEGFIKDIIAVDDGVQGILRLYLKYMDGNGVIEGIECVSTPGRRIYCSAKKVPRVKNGLGIAIISTSSGVKTDKEARKQNLGGEIICRVW